MISNDKCIVVRLCGGLGNQLFQYASGRALAYRLGYSLRFDLSWFQGVSDRKYSLGYFNLCDDSILQPIQKISKYTYIKLKLSRYIKVKILGMRVYRETSFRYDKNYEEIRHSVYMYGYWQSFKYFDSIKKTLYSEIKLSNELPESSLQIRNEILDSGINSICLHVRRGDYISNPSAAKLHGSCTLDYYSKSVELLVAQLKNPVCYIFSDDPEWVKCSLELQCTKRFVDVNGLHEAHLDLMLMSGCSKFVLANSTLSWWAAWLAQCKDKIVITPSKWFNDASIDTNDLIPTDWIKI